MEPDTPIKTIEDARRYFQRMGCSSFHLYRECPARYEEYHQLGISKEQEADWTTDSISSMLVELKNGVLDKKYLWSVHSSLVYLVVGGQLWQFLEDVYEASCAIQDSLSKGDRLLVAQTIVGRQDLGYRSSLILQSHVSGRTQFAVKFAELVRRLAGTAFKDKDKESWRQDLLSSLAETERLCDVEPP